MVEIDFKKIEEKWQKKWADAKIFDAEKESKKDKHYVLEMFPYPSAAGLHIGHAWNFLIGDILARYKKMNGFNVMHPMGFDALGLPAENAAIKNGTHPSTYTNNSINNFIHQQKTFGFSYDWSRVLNTASSDYYKWDQWIFLKMFEKGLAYQKESNVNWCPSCKTVLANEQAQSGNCDRCNSKVEIKFLKQWFLKITDYADELYENIDKLNWPERTKAMQKNWIGKSHGVEIDFEIENKRGNVIIVHGSNDNEKEALNGGVENTRHWHSWLKQELKNKKIDVSGDLYPLDWNPNYTEWKKVFERNNITENTILVGHSSGCGFILKYLNETKKKVKKIILVAPYVQGIKGAENLSDLNISKFDSNLRECWQELMVFYDNKDSKYIVEDAKFISKELGGKLIEFKNHKHFILHHMGTEKFPELLQEILYEKWPVFTTRADTLFGVTFMVMSAQHKKLWDLVTSEQKKEVEKFLKKLKSVSEKDLANMEKEGVFTGSYATNPATGKKIPIYAGNFVVADYGSGMVMAVPAHDQRDFEFAKKYGIEIKQVVKPLYAKYLVIEKSLLQDKFEVLNSFGELKVEEIDGDWGKFVGVNVFQGKEKDFIKFLEENLIKRDYSDGGSWYSDSMGTTNIVVFPKKHFEINSEKDLIKFKEYGKKVGIPEDQLDIKLDSFTRAFTEKGKLMNSDKFNGFIGDEAIDKICEFLEKKKLARKVINFRLRDWGISRQRYWGTPIPIIHCENCGVVNVPEKDLPLDLPKDVKFGSGNPLETNEKWINVKCPKCGKMAKRETDTMDTFVNSSWYFMRYCDSNNSKKIFDEKKVDFWCPVDTYIGGSEHACMHLIYARFYTKFLADSGLINFREPFKKLFHQGFIYGEDGEKMSKSLGNTLDPLDTSSKYGVDTTRFFLVSVASPDKDFNWSEAGIVGSQKFINKIWDFSNNFINKKDSEKIIIQLNQSIKNISEYYENFEYRKATIELRELFDLIYLENSSKETFEKFLKILNPICPHLTEEIWEKLGNKNFISGACWPIVENVPIKVSKNESNVNFKIINLIKPHLEKGNYSKIYIYILPFELDKYSFEEISSKLKKEVKIYSVSDTNKYDPESRAKRSKPTQPSFYLE